MVDMVDMADMMDNLTWISTLSIYLHHCSIQLEDIVGEVAEP